MEFFYIIAQAVGLLVMAFNILSYQQKTRERAIAFQLCGGGLFAVSFLLLGGHHLRGTEPMLHPHRQKDAPLN